MTLSNFTRLAENIAAAKQAVDAAWQSHLNNEPYTFVMQIAAVRSHLEEAASLVSAVAEQPVEVQG